MKTLIRDAGATGIMEPLAAYIAGALNVPLPDAATEKTKHHLLDTMAAMVSGTALKPGKLGVAVARAAPSADEALVIGTDLVTSAETGRGIAELRAVIAALAVTQQLG